MAEGSKIPFYITLPLCIIFLVAAGYLFMQLESTKQEFVESQHTGDNLQRQLNTANRDNANLKEEFAGEQQRAADLERKNEILKQQLIQVTQKIDDLTKEIANYKDEITEIEELKTRLQEAIEKREELERRALKTRQQHEKELNQLREQKLKLEQKLQEQTGEIPGAVKIENIKILTGKKFSGKIVAVNRKYNFIVVNIGKKDGLEEGTILIVHRGKNFVGKARVARVYDAMSAADLLKDWMQDNVEVGDGIKKF